MNVPQPLAEAIAAALEPRHFFVAPPGHIGIEQVDREEISWEVFRGHLLDETATRQRATVAAWHVVYRGGDGEVSRPVSIVYRPEEAALHVVRRILTYAHDVYEPQPRVLETREVRRWQRELTGSIPIQSRSEVAPTRPAELTAWIRQALLAAVVGTSRLPITSAESPLPGFALGQWGYFPSGPWSGGPPASPADMLRSGLPAAVDRRERARLVELALRSAGPDDVPALVDVLAPPATQPHAASPSAQGLAPSPSAQGAPSTTNAPPTARGPEAVRLLKSMFQQVSLAPYTTLVERWCALLAGLAARDRLGRPCVAELVSYYLRHLVRHVTAFDLVTFHNQGANYPDALLLEALLNELAKLIEPAGGQVPSTSDAGGRLVRRGLRQGWLLRQELVGLPVPDWPTSPGENLRVLPAAHPRVPEEQLAQPWLRGRRLFSDAATEPVRAALDEALPAALGELSIPGELLELGTALFLDRPLGIAKEPGAADRTTLLSYVAFSRQIAQRRLETLVRLGRLDPDAHRDAAARLAALDGAAAAGVGVAVERYSGPQRPGVVALEDARRAAGDFRFLETTRSSLDELLAAYEFERLAELCGEAYGTWLAQAPRLLLIRAPAAEAMRTPRDLARAAAQRPAMRDAAPESGPIAPLVLRLYDEQGRPRLELVPAQRDGQPLRYSQRAGGERLAAGLAVRAWWPLDSTGAAEEAEQPTGEAACLPPRWVWVED